MRKLTDALDTPFDVKEWKKAKDIFGKPMVLLAMQEKEGDNGKFMAMKCRIGDKGVPFGLTCGSKVVMRKVREALTKAKPPLAFKIVAVKDYYDVQ